LLRVCGGQFAPESGGQFRPEWVVSLRRIGVVTFIRISNHNSEKYIYFRVADSGIGISDESITKIFDRYYRVSKNHLGSGVGLALVKSLTQLHKGNIYVYSERDKGTEIIIGIPWGEDNYTEFEKATEDGAEAESQLEIVDNAILQPLQQNDDMTYVLGSRTQKHILIVDDNQELRLFLRQVFEKKYLISEARDGNEGLEMAVEKVPDLIISDVMMPGMNGYDFCNQIKTDERTNHIPVILLTANASVDKQLSGLKMGADIYLTKPFSIPVLELQVRNLIASAERLRQRYSRQLSSRYSLDPLKKQGIVGDNEPVVENDFINKIIALTELHLSDPTFDVEKICRNIGMSQAVLYRKMRALTSVSVNDIVKEVRFKRAAGFIAENKYTVYEVADMVGYTDTKYFSKEFKKLYGVSPRDYKLQQAEPSSE